MKKTFLLAIALLVPSYSLQADLKTATAKLFKCAWHVAQIGGGIACGASIFAFAKIASIGYKIPYIPELTGTPQDQRMLEEHGDKLVEQMRQLNPMFTKDVLLQFVIEQVRKDKGNNNIQLINITPDDMRTAYNNLRSKDTHRLLLPALACFAASSTSIWCGVKGLYDEVKQAMEPAEKADAEENTAI